MFLEAVTERDIDLLLLEELTVNRAFAEWFVIATECNEIHFAGIKSVEHSVTNRHGETDILLLYQTENCETHAILIENKISAKPQPDQAARYRLRAQQGVAEGLWAKATICLIAPSRYLENSSFIQGYGCILSYESIMQFFRDQTGDDPRPYYRAQIVNYAIDQCRRGYTPKIDKIVSQFWHEYWLLATDHYPHLELANPGERPSRSNWIQFHLSSLPDKIVLQHKANDGFVDLELRGKAQEIDKYHAEYRHSLPKGITIVTASKSLAFRIEVPCVDHFSPFLEQIQQVCQGLDAVSILYEFGSTTLHVLE